MSFGFRSGSTPVRTNPKWVRWAKVLAYYQSLSGADSRNDLVQTNTVRRIKEKILSSISGIPSSSPSTPPSIGLSLDPVNGIIWTWNETNPTSWSVQQGPASSGPWTEIEVHPGSQRDTSGLTQFNYFRVVSVGGSYDGTISNVVFLS